MKDKALYDVLRKWFEDIYIDWPSREDAPDMLCDYLWLRGYSIQSDLKDEHQS